MNIETPLKQQTARIRLVAQHRNARQPVRELTQTVTVLGSGDGCDLILASTKVDAAHAAIVRLNGAAYLCDLGAPNGTILNGRRIRWSRLKNGDMPAVGPFTFKVELEESDYAGYVDQPTFSVRNDRAFGIVRSVDPVLVIGSDSACDVVLSDASVAPRHALIVWTQEGPIVRDLLRRCAIRRNGEKVNSGSLVTGDCIGIGRYELIFDVLSAPAGVEATESSSETEDDHAESLISMPSMNDPAPSPTALTDSLAIPLIPITDEPAPVGESVAARQETIWTPPTTTNAPPPTTGQPDEEWKSRMIAAQNALDTRARKMWEGIQAERDRLIGFQKELQRKSQDLLDAAKEKQSELQAREEQLRLTQMKLDGDDDSEIAIADSEETSEPIPAPQPERADPEPPRIPRILDSKISANPAPADTSTLERLFSGLFEPEAATLRNAEETARLAALLVNEGIKTPEVDTNLARQAAELAELVHYEREEMESSEGRLETLRFEIERLQASLSRGQERQKMQETQIQARLATIRNTQTALRSEREELAARIRQLDAKEAALRARMEEAERVRREQEREARHLARLQEEHEERRRELRLNLEQERHRLRLRQAELQKKAAELVKAAKEKRRLIESEVAAKQAELQDREIELKSRRAALEDAGRAQLERTAAELEQVLTVRLNDIESEVTRRQGELDQRMDDLLGISGEQDSSGPLTPLEMSLDEIAALARLEEVAKGGDASTLEALREEVETLRQAVGETYENAREESSREDQLAALTSRRNQLQREQRWASILRAKLNEKIGALRGVDEATGGYAQTAASAPVAGRTETAP